MAMRPLLQAGLSTGVGLKKAESSFTASDLQEVCRLTRFGFRRSKSGRAARQKAAHSDPTTASLVVHCFAGISRSKSIFIQFSDEIQSLLSRGDE
jgi:hypothetical protein